MDWVKLGVRYYADDEIEAVDDAAEVMFTRGIARAGELERGGFIPESSVPRLTRRRRYAAVVDSLVASGLWTKVDGGYQITNWSDWQDALDELTVRRAHDRERQRKRRAKLREERKSTVSRDIEESSRDVTQPEGDRDLDSSGYLRGEGHVGNARETPPRTCPKHKDDPNAPPCWACKTAREAYEAWEAEQSKPPPKPPHCGECSETRHIELSDGRQARCPRCHPQRSAS